MNSPKRKPTPNELNLIQILTTKANFVLNLNWKDTLWVEDMNDGGMGSLTLYSTLSVEKNRAFGSEVSEIQFNDEDDVEVIVSLYLDQNRDLLELDFFKVNFGQLIRIPEKFDD